MKVLIMALLLTLPVGVVNAHEFTMGRCYLEHEQRLIPYNNVSKGTSRVVLKACLEHENIHGHPQVYEQVGDWTCYKENRVRIKVDGWSPLDSRKVLKSCLEQVNQKEGRK